MNLPENVKVVSIVKTRSVGMTTMSPQLVAHYIDGTHRDVEYDYVNDKLIEKWKKNLTPLLMDILK